MSQIALPLSIAGLVRDQAIVIGKGNRAVAESLRAPQAWPFHTAILTGPARAGKTMFAQWFAANTAGMVIDGVQREEETDVFHRWNRAQAGGQPLLLVVDGQGWDITLPDLASRMGAALQLRIEEPDDEMAAELVLAHAAHRGLALGEGAAGYLVPRMERSHAAIERVVTEIDRLSLERKAPATQSLWRDALEAIQGPEQARLL